MGNRIGENGQRTRGIRKRELKATDPRKTARNFLKNFEIPLKGLKTVDVGHGKGSLEPFSGLADICPDIKNRTHPVWPEIGFVDFPFSACGTIFCR